ncbi:MAG: TIGR02757 family protein [Bacteroidetes Order II. Incertae sedis bacterium]|nr:TIGR02757 family protein [Bacteroidetes Order II. bacterium]
MTPVTKPDRARLIRWLDEQVARFEQPAFIENDPISVPHAFEDPQDRAVIGFFAASLAWGQRKTTLNKMAELCERMGYRPMQFVYDFRIEKDAATLKGFKHRTFTEEDAYWMVLSLSALIRKYGRMEYVFRHFLPPNATDVGSAIQGFSTEMMYAVPGTPTRLQKHLARPDAGSACKRLNMFLRWMVRTGSVDFGIWKGIRSDQLVMPLDVHVGRVARHLGMLLRPVNDWKAALELTECCRELSPHDPVRYDFALFGWGVNEKSGALPNLMLPE